MLFKNIGNSVSLNDYILVLLAGPLIFLLPAIINAYPLINSDSGSYIFSGYAEWLPLDRPAFYGYFIRLFSFNESLWYTVLFQSLLLTIVLYLSMLS